MPTPEPAAKPAIRPTAATIFPKKRILDFPSGGATRSPPGGGDAPLVREKYTRAEW
jgi:hypothetical protein